MSEMSAKDRERIVAFERELAQDPRSLAFVDLAEELNRLGIFDEAASVAQKGLVYHPDLVAGRVVLAAAESGRSNIREALEQLKRALLIDQDNPRALALMGRILLQRGLARRAVQFLSHAVKLDPSQSDYVELLAQARKNAQNEAPASAFRGDQVRETGSPWAMEQEESEFEVRAPDAEHTVFDPDSLAKLRRADGARSGRAEPAKLSIGQALERLNAPLEDNSEIEPTRYDTRSQQIVQASLDRERPREEPTAFDAKLANAPAKKPKVGGSAAEFSQMMRNARDKNGAIAADLGGALPEVSPVEQDTPAAPWPVKREPPPVPPPNEDDRRPPDPAGTPRPDRPIAPPNARAKSARPEKAGTSARADKNPPAIASPEKVPSAPKKASSVPKKASSVPKKASSAPKKARPPKDEKAGERVPNDAGAGREPEEPRAVKEVEEKRLESSKAIGPAATRMVDDALWALLGGKAPSSQPAASPSPAAGVDKKPKKEDGAAADASEKPSKREVQAREEGRAPAPQQMVVRTSERFGTTLRFSIMLILVVSLTWIGYALGVHVTGQPPEISGEEVKGVALDLEAGSLASLALVEEKVDTLLPALPMLEGLFNGVMAEVYARRYAEFGRDPEMKKQARDRLLLVASAEPTVEILAARVMLSTSAVERAELDRLLVERLAAFPDSPKAWVLRAQLATADGRVADAEAALYRAREIFPQHRRTLLELARYHVRQASYPAAFAYFEQLQSLFPEDIESFIERYVVGQVTGKDPGEKQVAAALAGLVREKLRQVADDEVGRAALAFGVTRFSRGDVDGGLDEVAKAELSYRRSAEFKHAVGCVLLSVAEWERAERAFRDALELEPEVDDHRVGFARATFGRRAGLKADHDALKKVKSPTEAEVAMPYGTIRFVTNRFALVEFEPNRNVFPEAAYAAARKRTAGKALEKALEAASLVALANRKIAAGAEIDALALVDEAMKINDDAATRTARGRALLSRKDLPGAIAAFKGAIASDKDSVAARLGLALALETKGQLVEAIEVLELLTKGPVFVPQAHVALARIRTKRGDFEGASVALAPLTELEGNDPQMLLALGESQHRLKQPGEALETFRKAMKTPGKLPDKLTPIQAMYVGRLELERGNEKRGAQLLKESAETEDGPDEAHFYYGKFLLKSTKTRKQAKKELELFRKLVTSGELSKEAERLLR